MLRVISKYSVSLLVLIFSWSAQSQMVVGNGGGVFESQLVYAWSNLSAYIKPCLSTAVCGLVTSEKNILSAVLLESKSKPLVFVKESERSSIVGRFFETEQIVDAQVFINLDQLYIDGEKVLLEKRDFHEAILQLVAAKSFQHGFSLNESYLLGRKVADLARTQNAHIGLLQLGFPSFGFSIFSFADSSLVFLSDSDEMYELTTLIIESVPCHGAKLLKTMNMYWSYFSDDEALASAQIYGLCGKKSWSADLQVSLKYYFLDSTTIDRQLIFVPEKMKATVFDFELK